MILLTKGWVMSPDGVVTPLSKEHNTWTQRVHFWIVAALERSASQMRFHVTESSESAISFYDEDSGPNTFGPLSDEEVRSTARAALEMFGLREPWSKNTRKRQQFEITGQRFECEIDLVTSEDGYELTISFPSLSHIVAASARSFLSLE